jgi:hypothetical protein
VLRARVKNLELHVWSAQLVRVGERQISRCPNLPIPLRHAHARTISCWPVPFAVHVWSLDSTRNWPCRLSLSERANCLSRKWPVQAPNQTCCAFRRNKSVEADFPTVCASLKIEYTRQVSRPTNKLDIVLSLKCLYYEKSFQHFKCLHIETKWVLYILGKMTTTLQFKPATARTC